MRNRQVKTPGLASLLVRGILQGLRQFVDADTSQRDHSRRPIQGTAYRGYGFVSTRKRNARKRRHAVKSMGAEANPGRWLKGSQAGPRGY